MIFRYDDDGYDDGMLGSMVQVFEVATNTTACIPASAADLRGSATNPRPQHPAQSLVQFKACRPPLPLPPTWRDLGSACIVTALW